MGTPPTFTSPSASWCSGGRPPKDYRLIINGILWILRNGAPWRDLPPCYCLWQTVASRFYLWRRKGIWAQLIAALQQQSDGAGQLDWSLHQVDSTIIRAHCHAAGAKGGGDQALGISRGGFSTKIHLRCEGQGLPITMLLTVGERHDAVMMKLLMEQRAIKRIGRGRPRIRPAGGG